jgi:signal transduction histidine kinase
MEASKQLMDTEKEKAKELLQNSINISKEGIENIRLTLKNLKSPPEQMGIHQMKLFLDEFSSKHDNDLINRSTVSLNKSGSSQNGQ